MTTEEYEQAIKALKENSAGLNRISFRAALEKMVAEVDLEIGDDVLRQIVAIRNQLVHQATFHPKYGNPGDQYRMLETFVSRFLMATFHYHLPPPPYDVTDDEL